MFAHRVHISIHPNQNLKAFSPRNRRPTDAIILFQKHIYTDSPKHQTQSPSGYPSTLSSLNDKVDVNYRSAKRNASLTGLLSQLGQRRFSAKYQSSSSSSSSFESTLLCPFEMGEETIQYWIWLLSPFLTCMCQQATSMV